MRKLTIVILAAIVLAACGTHMRKTARHPERQTLAGGYTQQRPLEGAESELFRTVTSKLLGVSYTPESVATQIVAGTNYRFICTAKTATLHPETYKAEVIVYKPLPGRGEPKITSIKRL